MLRPLFSLFLIFYVTSLYSQSTVQGYLHSGKQKSVEGIIVSLHENANQKKFLAYCISDAKGFYQLNYSGKIPGKALKVRSLLYQDTCIVLNDIKKEYNIQLRENIQMLKEVQVRSTPIISKGDTTKYITSAFAQKRDFSIGEVINRMPGFQLASNGKVLYQGREIEKYYIEGADLLEDRYNLANKNLPHKSVASVEVLHNHQSKKIFENRIASDQTSINIKLKKSVACTGRGEGGIAYEPLGRYINLTPMMFTKKYQFLGSYQSNDIGSDLSDQLTMLQYKNGKLQGIEKRRFEFLGLPSLYYPKIDKSRYLSNNANFVSINALRKLKDQSELKINAAYLADNIEEYKNNETTYYLDNGLFKTKEKYENRFHKRSLYADLNLKKNLSSVYLNNKLGYVQLWDKSKAIIQGDQKQLIQAKSPHRSLYNKLDCIIPFGNSFANFSSTIDLNESDEDLFFDPNVFSNILNYGDDIAINRQNLKNRSLIMQNQLQFSKSWHSITMQSIIGLDYETQDLKTNMYSEQEILTQDHLRNNILWNRTNYRIEPSFKYKTNKLKISLDIPLRYYSLHFDDKEFKSLIRKEELLIAPRIYLKYDWTSFFNTRIILNSSESIGSPNKMLLGNVIYDHRTIRSRAAQIDGSKSKSVYIDLCYRNVVTGLFARLNYLKKSTKKDFILRKDILSPGVFRYQLLAKNNNEVMDQISGEFTYYCPSMHLNTTLKSYYTQQKSNYLLGGQLKNFKVDMYTNSLKLNFDKWQFLALDYDYSISVTNQSSNGNDTQSIEQTHKARICYYIDSRQWLELRPEYSILSQSKNKNQEALFTDLVYSYTPKGSRFSYLLECRNIFNSKYIYSTFNSSLSLSYNEFALRPRQIVARILFSFGKN